MGVLAGASHAGDVRKGEEALKEIEALQQEMQRLSHQAQLTDKDIAVLEPWGNFEPRDLARLAEAGYSH